MKIKNTTRDFSDAFFRRMVSWCCKQLDLPVKYVRYAQFRNRSRGYSGHAWPSQQRICVSVANVKTAYVDQVTKPEAGASFCEVREPDKPVVYRVRLELQRDRDRRIDDFVRVTAHECAHLMLSRFGRQLPADVQRRMGRRPLKHGGSEQQTIWHEKELMKLFTADRAALVADWDRPAKVSTREVVPIAEKRQAKVLADLERWQRKLKLAQTKIRKLKVKARYYERKAACKQKGDSHAG